MVENGDIKCQVFEISNTFSSLKCYIAVKFGSAKPFCVLSSRSTNHLRVVSKYRAYYEDYDNTEELE